MSKRIKIVRQVFLNLLSIFFIIAGLSLAWPSAKILYNVQMSRDWPQVKGKVISSTLERRWASRADDLGQSYCPRVWFGYRVDQRDYISDSVTLVPPWTKFKAQAEELAGRYVAGDTVSIHYLPADPQTSVLDVTVVPPAECVKFGVGVLLLLIGGVALISTVFRGLVE
ncbi:MAG: DUF3592 domain-containing protein [Candidatus Omnitrophica bacterium]|nr:DUF3592 domain-containing protein [Candidatus Omnitrophota bacterium]